MSDFYGALESTSFRVKDPVAFLADPQIVWLQEHINQEDPRGFFEQDKDGYFAFGWQGQYPSLVLTRLADNPNEEDEEDEENYIPAAIECHILPGDVCQIQVSGYEKLIYVGGVICWVTSRGVVAFSAETSWQDKITEAQLAGDIATLSKQVKKITRGKPQIS